MYFADIETKQNKKQRESTFPKVTELIISICRNRFGLLVLPKGGKEKYGLIKTSMNTILEADRGEFKYGIWSLQTSQGCGYFCLHFIDEEWCQKMVTVTYTEQYIISFGRAESFIQESWTWKSSFCKHPSIPFHQASHSFFFLFWSHNNSLACHPTKYPSYQCSDSRWILWAAKTT